MIAFVDNTGWWCRGIEEKSYEILQPKHRAEEIYPTSGYEEAETMLEKEKEFDPWIITFCCNWGSFAGADFSKIGGFDFPKSIRAVKIVCANSLDPMIVLETLREGAEGVIVLGCQPGKCRQKIDDNGAGGNIRLIEKLLDLAGLDKGRVFLGNASADDFTGFGKLITDFIARIKPLGPNQVEERGLDEKLRIASIAASSIRSGILARKRGELIDKGNIYSETFTERQFDLVLDPAIEQEYKRAGVIHLAREGAKVGDIADGLGIAEDEVMIHITTLRQEGKLVLDGFENDGKPIFRSVIA